MTTEPELTGAVVAEITNKFGDPVAFAERELTVLVDIQKLPIGTKFYTAPPSSKTQDDSAVAESSGVQGEPTQQMLYAMAAMDGYHVGDRDMPSLQRWRDYWDAAMNPSEVLDPKEIAEIGGASQPKAPAPVPGVQGEPDPDWLAQRHTAIKNHHTYEFKDGELTLHADCIRDALRQGFRKGAANMAVGAVGGVGAAYDWEAEALLQRERIIRIANALRPDMGSFAFEDVIQAVEKILIARRTAPEQATTGSGQGVTDAERLDWLGLQDLDDLCFGFVKDTRHDGEICINNGSGPRYGATLRDAIDAAILSTASPAGEGEVKA